MNKIYAIDVGSGFTKFISNEQSNKGCQSFQSIVEAVNTDQNDLEFNYENVEFVVINSQKYIVGENASTLSSNFKGSLTGQWAGKNEWLALLYQALVKMNVKTKDTISLITGLPQAQYKEHKTELLKSLNRLHIFIANDKEYTLNIEAFVIPQAAAAMVYQAKSEPSILRSTVGVIDIGTYTTGLSALNNINFIAKKCGGTPQGVSNLMMALNEQLNREGQFIEYNDMANALLNKNIMHKGEFIDIEKQILLSAEQASSQIINTINQLWGTANDLMVYVAGGGAKHYFEVIKNRIPHAKLMDDSFYAVTLGMLFYMIEKNKS